MYNSHTIVEIVVSKLSIKPFSSSNDRYKMVLDCTCILTTKEGTMSSGHFDHWANGLLSFLGKEDPGSIPG